MKRALSLFLALLILLSTVSASAFSVDYLIAEGLGYTETTEVLDDGKMSHTYLFRYTPGLSAYPVVAFGESQRSRKNLLKIASTFGENAVAGMNADFFSFTTGIPLGALVADGRFLSSPVGNNALAIFEDGTLHIGKPDITSKIYFDGNEFDFYYNKYPLVYSLYLTDETYSDSTGSEFECLEILLKPRNDKLVINSRVYCVVKNVSFNTSDTHIKEDHFVLTVPNSHPSYEAFSKLHVGDSVEIEVTASDIWENALWVVGGGDVIVEEGKYIPETADEYADKVRYARTAVGITKSGEGIFFSVNGKKEGYSSGMTYSELADKMIELGAETVLNLDGGGSTTVGVKLPGNTDMKVMNYPTDGYPRGVSNAILFINTKEPDGIASNATLLPGTLFAMRGAEIELEEVFYDSSMTAVGDVDGVYAEYVSLSDNAAVEEGRITVTEGEESEIELAAKYLLPNGSEISTFKTLYVPESLDSLEISLKRDVLTFGQRTEVDINAEYYGFDVASSPSAFSWRFTENNSDVTTDGVLAENDVARLYSDGTLEVITEDKLVTATLVASYGEVSAETTLAVGLPSVVIDGFEALPESAEAGYKSEKALLLPKGSVSYDEPMQIERFPSSFTVMYKGSFNDEADLLITTSEGDEMSIPYTVKNDYAGVTGWSELEAVVPESLDGKLFVISPFTSKNEKATVIDNFTATYGVEERYFDDIDENWAKSYIESLYGMGLTEGYTTDDGRRLFDPLREITRAEFAKFVTLFKGLQIEERELPFNDNELIAEWARPYVSAVSENGIMNGRREGDGTILFAPDDKITRTEAMIVISRLLPDLAASEITFKDADTIPEWALESVAKAISSGIITGYDDNTLRAQNNIMRAEVAVIFSRLYDYLYAPKIDITEE